MADDEDYRRPGRDNPIYEMATGLSDLQQVSCRSYITVLNP